MAGRVVQCAGVALAAAAAVFVILVLLTPIPRSASVILAGAGLLVFFIGYLRSPYFARSRRGPPCTRCGGTGYFIEVHPFSSRRDVCPRCRGAGVLEVPRDAPPPGADPPTG
ncbi:MAG TPA: hypothetical protein PKD59_11105 [Miltoncostaeaceae bacterium]|nr:hypothetical protein [Miltoncostaeaceae bacterium]